MLERVCIGLRSVPIQSHGMRNMRNLRDVYMPFLEFILSSAYITWELGPGDQGAFRTFFKADADNTFLAGFLPFTLNWKSYWPINSDALIVHFHGPKCESDILPFLEDRSVKFDLFRGILDKCLGEGGCKTTCAEFLRYLQ